MRPITIIARIQPALKQESPWVRVHLDSIVLAGGRSGGPTVSASTPVASIRRLRVPGIAQVTAQGACCNACSAGLLDDEGATVTWAAYGSRRTVRKALKRLWRPGEILSVAEDQQHRILGWNVEESDHDLLDTLVRDGRAARYLPERWIDDAGAWTEGAHEPPYWHPGRQHRVADLGTRVELNSDVLMDVLNQDIRFTQEVAAEDVRAANAVLAATARRRLERLRSALIESERLSSVDGTSEHE